MRASDVVTYFLRFFGCRHVMHRWVLDSRCPSIVIDRKGEGVKREEVDGIQFGG